MWCKGLAMVSHPMRSVRRQFGTRRFHIVERGAWPDATRREVKFSASQPINHG